MTKRMLSAVSEHAAAAAGCVRDFFAFTCPELPVAAPGAGRRAAAVGHTAVGRPIAVGAQARTASAITGACARTSCAILATRAGPAGAGVGVARAGFAVAAAAAAKPASRAVACGPSTAVLVAGVPTFGALPACIAVAEVFPVRRVAVPVYPRFGLVKCDGRI